MEKPMIIIAGGILISACLAIPLWLYLERKSESSLLRVRILTRDSLCGIIEEIRSVYSKSYYKSLLKARLERRRSSRNWLEYSRIVTNFHRETKILLDEATISVLNRYRTTKNILEDSINYYDSDPELREHAENLVYPLYESNELVSLTKYEIKDILSYFSKRFQEIGAEDLDFDDYLIATSQIEDEVYFKYKVEMDEVNSGYELYKDEFNDIVEPMRTQTSYIMASAGDSFEL